MRDNPPRLRLLAALLDTYERSSSFARPAPWPRDAIVRLDSKTFPDAYHADARETLEALRAAAEWLVAEQAARCERERGLAGDHVKALRLGPSELEQAYRLAVPLGYIRLSDELDTLRTALDALRAEAGEPFMHAYLEQLATGLEAADSSALGMRRERLKRERRDVEDAVRAACAIARGEVGWERMLSERLFRDSKRLSAIRARVIDVLLRADPRFEGALPDEDTDVLAVYGMRRRPGFIVCSGAGELRHAGQRIPLESFEPCAKLPEAWTRAWVDAVATAGTQTVTTIENEYPFYAYIEEAGGARGLRDRAELVLYSGGFPARYLAEAYRALATACGCQLRHYGDADGGGVRIWFYLRRLANRPVYPHITTARWLRALPPESGTPLSAAERARLTAMRPSIDALAERGEQDAREVLALVDALLELGIKVEQERG